MTSSATPSPPPPDAPPSAWVGHTLGGRFQIRELLGEGGMGAVFTAEQISLHKLVAVKMIHAEFADNEEVAERFRREAMATAKIEHPNVVSAIEFGELPGGIRYLVSQLVRGPSLLETQALGRMPWPKVAELGAQIADALAAAHAAGIVHRDLKPENIKLEPREEGPLVKVLDFGIARVPDATAGTAPLTRLGTVMGTPGYMSPEQAMGEPTDHRTDLYALGVILWECLSGRTLWEGGEMSDMRTRQLTQPPPPLAGEIPDLPPEFERLVQQLLAREAKQRPASAREVRDTLRSLSRGVAQVPLSIPPPPARPPVPTAPASGGPLGFIAVFVGAAILIVIVWALRGGPDASPPSDGPPADFVPAPHEGKAHEPGPAVQDAPEPDPKEPASKASPTAELPPALAPLAATLLGEDTKAFLKAGKAVLAHAPESEVPPWLRGLALLAQAESCEAKRAAVKRISEANDKRGLAALQRLAKEPRNCGLLKNKDCLECMRSTLNKSIEQLAALP